MRYSITHKLRFFYNACGSLGINVLLSEINRTSINKPLRGPAGLNIVIPHNHRAYNKGDGFAKLDLLRMV